MTSTSLRASLAAALLLAAGAACQPTTSTPPVETPASAASTAPLASAAPASAAPTSAAPASAASEAPTWGVEGFHAIYTGVFNAPVAFTPGGGGPSPMPAPPQVIRSTTELAGLIGRIPSEAISKTNPAPPSDDPLLKKPAIDFEKHMVLVAFRTDYMNAKVFFKGVRQEGGTLRVKVETPPAGDAAMMAQPQGIGAYTAVVVDRFDGEVIFE